MVLALSSSPAIAQDENDSGSVELPTLVVEGEEVGGIADPASPEGYVPTESTAGSKTATPIEEIPQSVSVIGREEMDDRGAQKVDEALRYTPGVFAQPFGVDTDTDWAYIRGFDVTQSGMFLDGLQLYSYAFAGIINDSFLLDGVEVLRGPASVLYGGSSAGGVVNQLSKRANGERIRYLEAGITDSPNGYLGFDIGDQVSEDGPWSYRLVGRIKGGDTQVEHADNFRGVIAPSLLFEPDNDTRLELFASYQYDDQRHTNGFFPYVGTVERASYGYIPRDLYYSEPERDKFEAEQSSIGYELEHQLNDTVTLRSTSRWFHVEREEYGPYPYDTNTSDDVLSRINFAHDTTADLAQTDNQAIFDVDTGPLSHTLMTGVSYENYRIDQWQASGSARPLDPKDPTYTNSGLTLNDPYTDETITLDRLGLYAQDQVKFGDGWIVTLNGRYDRTWIDRNDRTAADVDYSDQDGAFSGRAGLAYAFDNGITPYVSATRFFEPQIGTDGNNDPVGPQTGNQYEAGVKYQPTFMQALFTASVFELTRSNTLQSVWDGSGYSYSTVGEIRSRGIELEAKANVTDNLKLTAALTRYDLEITDDIDQSIVGNQPRLVPETLASVWLDYTIHTGTFQGLGFGAGVRYQGESYADNANTLKVPDAAPVDAAIHYDRDGWGVSLNVTNVFDERYVAGCQGAETCGYGEGRTALLKTHINF
ncbi:TonB-dependent siderophore receptor [Rhodovibrio salinarum]|uniref:TonB-dependent siderophore receptor n=1 Tax=Rhodovibrio salinarum TaxID=1087 RepID=A0A934QJD3_9PROT|nr:TonB-dependent siderophore receptor [Rhodovibrio salinarum]MBK1697957.1 TonB-dependent siderophore receptor [Rhodovibrio salinarum]